MTIFHGVAGPVFLNSGMGAMQAALGASIDQTCIRSGICFTSDHDDGGPNELSAILSGGGGHLSKTLLLNGDVRGSDSQEKREREIRVNEFMSRELRLIVDFTSGPLREDVSEALDFLENRRLFLHGSACRLFVGRDPARPPTCETTNALVIRIREKSRMPELRAYMETRAELEVRKQAVIAAWREG